MCVCASVHHNNNYRGVHEFQKGLGEDGRIGIGRRVEIVQVKYPCIERQLS